MHAPLRYLLIALAAVFAVPMTSFAQASIAGIVRDTSGAVLPGVTVEAASPALIEKVRSAVTDDSGQFRIVDLRPGTYNVTFTLQGFSVIRREGIQLTGTFTATVNADLQVGSVEETVTVTGEAPAVDVQTTLRQRVMDREILESLPIGRNAHQLTILIPGASVNQENVGGSATLMQSATTVHGSRSADQVETLGGLTIGGPRSGGGGPNLWNSNFAAYQEVTIDTAAVDSGFAMGGVRINHIPRDGGNTFGGTFFTSLSTEGMQGDNYTDELRAAGLRGPNTIKKIWDLNPGFGGPIKRDKAWFFAAGRYSGSQQYPAGIFFNRNAGDPNAWTYAPDESRRPFLEGIWKDATARLSWQATARHKLGLFWQEQTSCYCPEAVSATRAPEADFHRRQAPLRSVLLEWTNPLTNRLLFDGAMISTRQDANRLPVTTDPAIVAVTDQALGNLTYRGFAGEVRTTTLRNTSGRAAASYITGAHALKLGVSVSTFQERTHNVHATQPYSFRFNNGVPNQIDLFATPHNHVLDIDNVTGVYGQGNWTIRRLTLSYGLRYDYYKSSFPETRLGPAPLVPNRNITLPAAPGLAWHDISPKMAGALDLFGDGKTAVKVTMNKYLAAIGAQNPIILGELMAPVRRLVNTTSRSWTDANRNFVPECDLVNPLANGECGPLANRNFGTAVPGAAYDPDLISGWGKREYQWEFSAGVQRELRPRMSVDVSYFRRSYANFIVTDNRALAPADFDRFSITAPAHPGLPGGGRYSVDGLYTIRPEKFGVPADDYVTFAGNYGEQTERWHGVDMTLSWRPGGGTFLQGGLSTGQTATNNCEVLAKLPEIAPTNSFCDVDGKFRTDAKFMGAYTLPRVDVQVSGTWRNEPGPQILADYVATDVEIVPSLGRNLAGGVRNLTIGVVEPGTMYVERRNQLDFRFAKIVRLGGTRANAGVDIYNILNSSPVLTQSNAFATWLRPQSILLARFFKLSMTLDF